jgi:hypothetical protein
MEKPKHKNPEGVTLFLTHHLHPQIARCAKPRWDPVDNLRHNKNVLRFP